MEIALYFAIYFVIGTLVGLIWDLWHDGEEDGLMLAYVILLWPIFTLFSIPIGFIKLISGFLQYSRRKTRF